jgi:hypothetical protein
MRPSFLAAGPHCHHGVLPVAARDERPQVPVAVGERLPVRRRRRLLVDVRRGEVQLLGGVDEDLRWRSAPPSREVPVLRLLGLLLVVWLVLTVVGAVVKGLFWLAVVGLVFFIATAALGWNKRDRKVLPRGW